LVQAGAQLAQKFVRIWKFCFPSEPFRSPASQVADCYVQVCLQNTTKKNPR